MLTTITILELAAGILSAIGCIFVLLSRDSTVAFYGAIISAIAIALYQKLGFILTMTMLVFTLLVAVERKNVFRAAAYSLGLTMIAWWVFGTALKSPLETGILGF